MARAASSEPLVIEDRAWPLLVVRFPSELSEGTVRSVIDGIERAYDRRARFALVVDITAVAKIPAAPARRLFTDWVASAQRAERERAFMVASALVTSSGPLRALTSAILLIRPPLVQQQWAATLAEGVEWTRQCLLKEGIALSAAAEAQCAAMSGKAAQAGQGSAPAR